MNVLLFSLHLVAIMSQNVELQLFFTVLFVGVFVLQCYLAAGKRSVIDRMAADNESTMKIFSYLVLNLDLMSLDSKF